MRMTIRPVLAALALALAAAVPASGQEPEKLKVGSMAPDAIGEHVDFVQGDAVSSFSRDKVYVVEFWATWCGPCKQAIPHVNKLYQELSGKGLVVIGVSDEPSSKVKPFVEKMGSSMSYTVAVNKKEDTFMDERWKRAADVQGIPTAFVVNRAGKVVYIGHPMAPEFARAVRLSCANRYDPELFARVEPVVADARRLAKSRDFRQASQRYQEAVGQNPATLMDYALENWRMLRDQAGDSAAASAAVKELIGQVKRDRFALAELARYLATATDVKSRDLDAAQMAADALKAIAPPDDASAMDALAAVAAAKGDWASASDLQYDAYMAAPTASKAEMKKQLETYEKRRDAAAK